MNKEYFNLGTREEQKQKLKEMNTLAKNFLSLKECKECSDRGYTAWDTELNQYIPCTGCVLKAAEEVRKQKIEEINKVQNPENAN